MLKHFEVLDGCICCKNFKHSLCFAAHVMFCLVVYELLIVIAACLLFSVVMFLYLQLKAEKVMLSAPYLVSHLLTT